MNTKEVKELAEKLINKDFLEMSETEKALVRSPERLEDAQDEIERLRILVRKLAGNELSEITKKFLLSF